jgi:hypothetical protein
VPVLASSGVDALTVGCNSAGAPPGVPKNQPFIWQDLRTGTEIVAMWHAGHAAFPSTTETAHASQSSRLLPARFCSLIISLLLEPCFMCFWVSSKRDLKGFCRLL